ncbi:MAG: hypothetical protein ACOC12_11320, partial [Bacteroidota bacterium]
NNYHAENSLDLSHWLDAPAGKHGFVTIEGKDFVFEDGTPVKFWGTNIASSRPFMSPEEAKEWTSILGKYGMNAVRFHKFTWDATDGYNSTVIIPEKWKNFDYLCQQLREKGIYYGWSHIYGHKVRPGDSSRMLAYEELANTKFPWAHLNGTTCSLVNFAEDLQTLNIELTTNMLNHVNPHTGLRYADDPALNFIELQNEDNIFWSAIERTLEQTPTYRKLLCQKFSNWLEEKYGNDENLVKAWNNKGLPAGESIARGNIYPQPNHSMFSSEYDQAVNENRSLPQHLLDKAAFLYEEQMKFYNRFVKAIRDTGYLGPIVGSCWQAGGGITHLLNLHADYEVGIIDRHNYFGGGTGHRLDTGNFRTGAMVSQIGTGLYSTGLQQVANRPFALSEWMSLIPNQWTAEAAPLIATYGMGLQGWDASYSFAFDYPFYSETVQTRGGGVYNVTSPTHMSLYPALAMMIYRDDVKEGATIANRNVSIDKLLNGDISFHEKVVQDYDRKGFEASFPLQAMAAGKVTVTFTEDDNKHEIGTIEVKNGEVRSNTGQLLWSEKGKGYFTVDSEGTKALVGFAPGQWHALGDVKMKTNNEFAVIYLSSMDQEKSIAEADQLLVTTIARAINTGMEYQGDKLVKTGEAPVLMEPVVLDLQLDGSKKYKVTVLDHVGTPTSESFVASGKRIKLDGSKYKAIYYLIEEVK